MRWQFRRIFCWLRCGVLHFFCRPSFLQEICKTKWTLFIILRAASILHPFCFANFSKKTLSTEKIEYTTTKPTENPSKLSSQIFNFWHFVTEIFESLCTFFWGTNSNNSNNSNGLQLQWTINVELIFCLSLPQAKLLYTLSNSNSYHVKLRSLTKSPTPIAATASSSPLQSLQLQ